DVETVRKVLAWHPTEATAIVAAAAIGVRGAVEMRRGGTPTPITDHSTELWTLGDPSLRDFPLALALRETTTLDAAERVMRRLAVDELDFERAKASAAPGEPQRQTVLAVTAALEGLAAGATHITKRRLAETADAHDLE